MPKAPASAIGARQGTGLPLPMTAQRVEALHQDSMAHALSAIDSVSRFTVCGRIQRVVGGMLESSALPVAVGEICRVAPDEKNGILAHVAGFDQHGMILMPLGDTDGIRPGALVIPVGRPFYTEVGDGLIGRVLDGLGRPRDDTGPVGPTAKQPLHAEPPNPMERPRIAVPFATGVRAIDGLITLGLGQRIGIMAGSGVGKSVLLGMIAKRSSSDVNVIALLGERGREVRDFIERDLGEEGLKRSVLVVATSDQSSVVRATGALVATSIAEHFRDSGRNVLLMMDSVTRVAMAWREIGLAVGEPPTTKGYTPSVFTHLPKLLERAGTSARGSITGLYTVLVEGDDFQDPIADATRSILDGHIVLSRKLANAKHFPAIDVLESVSRVRDDVIPADHKDAALTLLRLESIQRSYEDLIAVGAYQAGSDREVDCGLAIKNEVTRFLRQRPDETSAYDDTTERVKRLAQDARSRMGGE